METHFKTAQNLAKLLDNEFKVFGFRVGLDPIIGLIPWIGDFLSFGLSLYILWISYQLRLPSGKLAIMIRNIVFDLVLGLIPVVGDIGDFFFRANKRNMDILQRYYSSPVIEGKLITH